MSTLKDKFQASGTNRIELDPNFNPDEIIKQMPDKPKFPFPKMDTPPFDPSRVPVSPDEPIDGLPKSPSTEGPGVKEEAPVEIDYANENVGYVIDYYADVSAKLAELESSEGYADLTDDEKKAKYQSIYAEMSGKYDQQKLAAALEDPQVKQLMSEIDMSGIGSADATDRSAVYSLLKGKKDATVEYEAAKANGELSPAEDLKYQMTIKGFDTAYKEKVEEVANPLAKFIPEGAKAILYRDKYKDKALWVNPELDPSNPFRSLLPSSVRPTIESEFLKVSASEGTEEDKQKAIDDIYDSHSVNPLDIISKKPNEPTIEPAIVSPVIAPKPDGPNNGVVVPNKPITQVELYKNQLAEVEVNAPAVSDEYNRGLM